MAHRSASGGLRRSGLGVLRRGGSASGEELTKREAQRVGARNAGRHRRLHFGGQAIDTADQRLGKSEADENGRLGILAGAGHNGSGRINFAGSDHARVDTSIQ